LANPSTTFAVEDNRPAFSPDVLHHETPKVSESEENGMSGYDDYFQLLFEGTNQPAAFVRYYIKRSDGRIEHGMTDHNGYTHLLQATLAVEDIKIHIEAGNQNG
jgi:uncharacterized protein (DUF2345 family)